MLAPEAALRGEKAALGDEEAVGRDAEAGVMMKAAPATPLIVAEADLLLQFRDGPAVGGLRCLPPTICHRSNDLSLLARSVSTTLRLRAGADECEHKGRKREH